MKRYVLLFSLFVFDLNILSAQDISEKIIPLFTLRINQVAPPDGYGITPDKPVLTGSFLNMGNMEQMMLEMAKFYNTYRWPNGDKINFDNRSSITIPGKGIIDCYFLSKPGSKDTLKLYVNPYQKGDLYLPKGLSFPHANAFAKEIKPFLQKIEDIANAKDAFVDSTIKERQAEVMIYIQMNIGLDYLVDEKIMWKLMSDKSATMDLRGFLFRTYLFSTFWALAKGFENEKEYAIRKMAEAYRKVKILHPEISSKIYDEWLTK